MKKLFPIIFSIIVLLPNISFSSPKIGINELLILTEENPNLVMNAEAEAIKLNMPLNIYTPDKVLFTVKLLENGKPVYAVFRDLNNLYKRSYTAFYEDFKNKINFSKSRVDYGNGNVSNNTIGFFQPLLKDFPLSSKVLMIPESANDKVYIFDSFNGDLIDTNFIPTSTPQLSTPINALQHFNGSQILVSDQINDVVQKFNSNGIYNSLFAPAGGLNNAILDNIRGISYRGNNNLLVTVGSGASTNTIQQFDTAGNSLGTFISGNITSPFAIFYKQNDILISCSSGSNDISKFDLNGNFISVFHSSANLNFPQQMIQLGSGDIAVAGFSLPSGIIILDSTGVYKKTLNVVTGNRGVYLLGNGNYLTTSGTSVYEIDSSSGAIIRTIIFNLSYSFRFISEYNFTSPSLRLTVNLESCPSPDLFSVQLRSSSPPYNLVDSQVVTAGAGIPAMVSFPSALSGVNYYIIAENKNSIATWSNSPVSFISNYLKYNFTDAVTKAYGSNMINVGGKWSFYQGDVDKDNFIDLTDLIKIYNDATSFITGNVVTDLNCDGFVDLTDIILTYNNSSNFVQVQKP